MRFRNQGESAGPAHFRNVSGLLLAFVAFSLFVHAGGLLFPTENIVQLPESRFGSNMISTVLVPTENTPETKSPSRPAPPPAKIPSSKPAETVTIIQRYDKPATIMAKTTFTKITSPGHNKPLTTKPTEEKTATENVQLEDSAAKSVQTSRDQLTREQHQKQQAQQRNYLLGEIQNQLARYLSYPLRARKRGWQGEVMLAFHINESGQLNNVRLAKSSGYSLLDRSAMKAIVKLKYIAMPDAMGRPQAMDLQLPVQFKLYEG